LRRGWLVAALVGVAQAAVFSVGWLLVYGQTHEQVALGVEEVIVRANVAAAEAVVRILGGIPDVGELGSPEWERVQGVVEHLELGGAGFACVMDTTGHIVCHPDIREQPGLRGIYMAAERLVDLERQSWIRLDHVRAGATATGLVDYGADGMHYIATHRDPDSGMQLLVHQPVSGLTAASKHVTGAMLVSMLGIGACVVALTAALAGLLVRAHDRTMARWNRELEGLVTRRTGELTRTHRAIIFGIAKLAEYRDNDTGLHVERMCAYVGVLAREYQRRFGGLDPRWIEDLELAASMHDIGKVAIPDHILLKPGRLTPEEYEQRKLHAEVGRAALIAVRDQVDDPRLLNLGIEIAGAHHERWDGSGYPHSLAGDAIPLSARIVAVADVFDALMSRRVYKEALPVERVLRILSEGSGTHFDPRVLECFEAVADELRLIHARLQDTPGQVSPLPHSESRALADAEAD